MKRKLYLLLAITLITTGYSKSQTNYDESKVPVYELPALLISENGTDITDSKSWMKVRRPEILSLFEKNMYGQVPGKLKLSSWKILETDNNALNGKAIRKQILLTFKKNGKQLDVNLLIYLPAGVDKAPLFVGYNFYGNHTIAHDPEIIVPTSWTLNNLDLGITDHQPNEKSRGVRESRWPVQKIIDAGYGLATLYYGDVDPDKFGESGNDFSDGVHPLLYKQGQTKPLPHEWQAISAWSWGLSRAMDYFEQDSNIDASKVVVMGHSRLGKASLWAGAQDQRFAIVISNNSGSGGAALARRQYGERLGGMNGYFQHWFCDNLSKYDYKENELPFDQHMLIALIAPRPVYIASGIEDIWADPKGEYLSAYHATPVYALFGKPGLASPHQPEENKPVMTTIGYHIRSGGHDVKDFDWEQFINFANLHLKP